MARDMGVWRGGWVRILHTCDVFCLFARGSPASYDLPSALDPRTVLVFCAQAPVSHRHDIAFAQRALVWPTV